MNEAAKVLDLEQHLDRKPANLSGGQRQRVAMGRAIVRDPAAFLMDEPLSNLDAKLRVQMRTEVSRIQQRLGTTTVYVTHDQTEAMTLGDRVAVMRAGELQQVDTPMELYNNPKNLFVAGFIGSPAMNFMPATVEGGKLEAADGRGRTCREGTDAKGEVIAASGPSTSRTRSWWTRRPATAARRSRRRSTCSSRWAPSSTCTSTSRATAACESKELEELAQDAGRGRPALGEAGQVMARLDRPSRMPKQGEEVELWIDAPHIQLFDPNDGRSLRVRLAQLLAQALDHVLVPVVRAQQHVAQA